MLSFVWKAIQYKQHLSLGDGSRPKIAFFLLVCAFNFLSSGHISFEVFFPVQRLPVSLHLSSLGSIWRQRLPRHRIVFLFKFASGVLNVHFFAQDTWVWHLVPVRVFFSLGPSSTTFVVFTIPMYHLCC